MRDAIRARLRSETARRAGRISECFARASLAPEAAAFLRSLAEEPIAEAPDRGGAPAPHPIDRLAAAFRIAGLDLDLLFFAALAEEHEGLAGVLRHVHPRGEPRATPGLVVQVLGGRPEDRDAVREALEAGAAVRSGAVRLTGDAPFFERNLEIAPCLWSALYGIDAWPAQLRPLDAGAPAWDLPSQPEGAADAAGAARALTEEDARTLLVWGDTEEAARAFALALARRAGVSAACFQLAPHAPADAERLLSLHAVARGLVPLLGTPASPLDGPGRAELPAMADHPGPVVLCAQHGVLPARSRRPLLPLTVPALAPSERSALWRAALPELASEADAFAARYRLDAAGTAAIAADARCAAGLAGRAPRASDVSAAVSVRNAVAIPQGLRLVRPEATWDRLVLPADRAAQLREGVARLVHQPRVIDEWRFLDGRPGSRGVRMLFAGPPGTGKTLAAEVLARELGVDLLVVDVSRVVSKWIGETEKNLSAVFDAAEHAQAVLLFDEADALFGKRTEVSDAHDRYANLETAYLLSRVERFEGLAILTTNLRQNIDPAFLRRLEIVVDFQEPDVAERRALWRAHIPERAPLAPDLSLQELAALYPVVGGLIKNAAVAAGFLAASEQAPIGRRHVVRAIFREYEKSGRAFPGLPPGMTSF